MVCFEALSALPGWQLLDAVRNRRFAVISDAVNRPAPRIVSAIEDLARQLHPTAFQEQSVPEKPAAPAHIIFNTRPFEEELACAR